MNSIQAILLALIQGITEFLPISSSAHLILMPLVTAWPDQGLAYDVALNTGTSLAICIYLRHDLKSIIGSFYHSLKPGGGSGRYTYHDGRLAWMLIAGTIPVLLSGYFFHDLISGKLRSIEVIAWSSIGWGIVLWFADRRPGLMNISGIGWIVAIIIGISQAIAIIPGTSRSGITITAGLFCGLTRSAAARFSFLLSVPVGLIAGGYEGLKLIEYGMDTPWTQVLIGFLIAFVLAYLTIHIFLKIVERVTMTPFAAYRVLLGVILLIVF